MFKTKKCIILFIVALMGIALCQAAENKKSEKSTKVAKTSKVTNAPNDPDKNITRMIELGFFSPIQISGEDTVIHGLRFSTLYTYNKGMKGFDCGFFCDSGLEGNSGLQFAFSNRTAGIMRGICLGLVNVAETEIHGMQLGAFYNQAGSDSLDNEYSTSFGFQCAAINTSDSIFTGMQLGLINISNIIFNGVQMGFINLSEHPSDVFNDFQTKDFKEQKKKRSCVQIGFINFNPKGLFPITLLLNF